MEAPIKILISGTGTMGRAFTKAVHGSMDIVDFALTGDDYDGDRLYVEYPYGAKGPQPKVVKPAEFEAALESIAGTPNLVAVEFANPGTNNTALFAKHNIPWVSGTTGVKKEELAGCGVYDVNMAPSLVAIGSALEFLGNVPLSKGILNGFKGWFAESHQLYKADPSGTRKKWNEPFEKMGAELDMMLPERLEPEGHGYHKVNMHSDKLDSVPCSLWKAILQYAASNFKSPFAGFDLSAKLTSNDDIMSIYRILKSHETELGVRSIAPHPSIVDKKETKGAELANVYFILGKDDAAINFYFNAHEKRGTNAGFETRVNGRGLYQPGIIAAVKHVYDRFYAKGQKEGIGNMMDVLKK